MADTAAERPARDRFDLACGSIACDHSPGSHGVVLFIHGNSSCGGVFDAQRRALERAGWGVAAVDLPGHGRSDDALDPLSTYSFPGYANAVVELIDALGLDRVHLVGWSLGGHVALELAAKDARVASALVTGAPPIAPSPQALVDAFSDTSDMALASRERFSRADAETYVGAMLDVPGRAPQAMVETALRTDGRARRLMVASALAGAGVDQRAVIAQEGARVAILQGRNDPFLRNDYFERLDLRRLWRGGVQWLDGLGHAPHWSAPHRFNDLLLAFLADQRSWGRR